MKLKLIFTILLIGILCSSSVFAADEKGFFSNMVDWLASFFKDEPTDIVVEKVTQDFSNITSCSEVKENVVYYTTVQKNKTIASCSDEPTNQSCSNVVSFYNESSKEIREETRQICNNIGMTFSDGSQVNFTDNNIGGCNQCGEQIICWHKYDGWNENRNTEFSCTCKSGERCVIYDLSRANIPTFKNFEVKE